MDHIFNYVYALGLTPDERDRIAKIQEIEPDTGDLQIFEMIVEALPDHSVTLMEEFEEWWIPSKPWKGNTTRPKYSTLCWIARASRSGG